MKQTSLLAWQHTKKSLPMRQLEILAALRELGGQGTMHRVALRLGLPLNTISGRFSELEKKGWIRVIATELTPGYRPRSIYFLYAIPNTPNLINQGQAIVSPPFKQLPTCPKSREFEVLG